LQGKSRPDQAVSIQSKMACPKQHHEDSGGLSVQYFSIFYRIIYYGHKKSDSLK
jgi:hypothetical protein